MHTQTVMPHRSDFVKQQRVMDDQPTRGDCFELAPVDLKTLCFFKATRPDITRAACDVWVWCQALWAQRVLWAFQIWIWDNKRNKLTPVFLWEFQMVHILPHPLHHSTLHVDLQTCWSKDSILRQVNYYLWYWAYARTACVCAHLHTVILQNYHAPARWSIQHGKALITLLLGERCTAIT